MLSNQEKLLEFSKSIQRELEGQIAQIDSEIAQFQESQTWQIDEEIKADSYRVLQRQSAKLALEFTTERSRKLGELKRGMLLKRDELVGKVFAAVRGRLLDFAAGEEYGPYLRGKLREADAKYHFKKPRVLVRQQDLALAPEIKKVLPAAQVEASADITVGGFILMDEGKSYVLNESLDNTLLEQKEWFYAHSGLRITQL